MLFSGYVNSVSKPFNLKSNPNAQGCFFILMINGDDKSAKYIKCLTYNKNLITILQQSTKQTIIFVENGYPDTSYSKDYLNTKTNKEGVSLQHFVVTAWSQYGMEDVIHQDSSYTVYEEPEEVKVEKVKEVLNDTKNAEFDGDGDLDEDTKENNENRQS